MILTSALHASDNVAVHNNISPGGEQVSRLVNRRKRETLSVENRGAASKSRVGMRERGDKSAAGAVCALMRTGSRLARPAGGG